MHFGKGVYANFNLTLVDDNHIYIGDSTLLGPNVVIATAGHPILPELREKGYQYNIPVRIGKNCWLGAGVVVLPGVTIGDNSVIGAGSIVTKDIPSNVVAYGNPDIVADHSLADVYADSFAAVDNGVVDKIVNRFGNKNLVGVYENVTIAFKTDISFSGGKFFKLRYNVGSFVGYAENYRSEIESSALEL